MLICGFITQSTSEYSASSGATVMNDSSGYCDTTYLRLAASTGYVRWTGLAIKYQACVSANVKVPSVFPYIPIKIDRGTYEYYIKIVSATSLEIHQTINGGTDTTIASATIDLVAGDWTNFVLESSEYKVAAYVDTKQVAYSGLYNLSITDITQIDVINQTSGYLYIDDIVAYPGKYEKTVAIVLPYSNGTFGDRSTELLMTGANSNSLAVSDIPNDGDTSYVYATGAMTGTDIYIPELPPVTRFGYPISIKAVPGIAIHHISKSTGGASNYAQAVIDHLDTLVYGSQVNPTSSYALYTQYLTNGAGGTSWVPDDFYSENGDRRIYIGIKLSSSTSYYIRTTTLVTSVLCLLVEAPNIPVSIENTGGFDVRMRVPFGGLSSGATLQLKTNVVGLPINTYAYPIGATGTLSICFLIDISGNICVYVNATNSIRTSESIVIGAKKTHDVRIVMHDSFISIFMSDVWYHTFVINYVDYPESSVLKLNCSSAITITNIVVSELYDWREATYVEMDTPGMSGVSSIIQGRPVEVSPRSGGVVDFSYNTNRSTVTLNNIYSHATAETITNNAGSHVIVYYSNVAIVTDPLYMDSNGYLTKVYQLSELDHGAITAARILARKARESMVKHSIDASTDIRVEPGDIVSFSYTVSGTGTEVVDAAIVESVSIGIQEARQEMSIQGRNYVAS